MTDIATMVERLIAGGAAPSIAAQVVAEAFAAGMAVGPEAARSARQERNARYYQARKDRIKASENRLNKTDQDVSDASKTASKKEIPPAPPKEKTTSYEVSNETSPEGAAAPQAYTDDRHELWGEGVAILAQLGVPERSARSNIGRWLKDTGDNCRAVLDAIQRARDHRASSPIPWITNGLRTTNGARTHHPNRSDPAEDPILAGMGRLAARLVAKNQPARSEDREVPGGLDLAGGPGPRLVGAS